MHPKQSRPAHPGKRRGPDRRKSGRQPSDKAVRIWLPGRGVSLHGHFLDLSEGGCRIEPNDPFLVWNDVRVEIRFEALRLQFILEGVTKGSRGGKSFGVQFDRMSAESLSQLRTFLPTLPAAPNVLPAGIEPKREDQPVGAPEAVESSKKDQAAPGRPGPVPVVRLEPPPKGVERRVHPRYIVEARAVLFAITSRESWSGQILEVSRSGCRFYLDEPFGKELGMQVELTFDLHGIPVRMAGITQTKIDQRTIGIRFDQASARKQQQLDEIISEIKANITVV